MVEQNYTESGRVFGIKQRLILQYQNRSPFARFCPLPRIQICQP